MKLENAMANPTAPTVVWISGAACTGCTMSLLNSVFYTTADDLLINRINLRYLDTVMATAGAYDGITQYGGANSIAEAQAVYADQTTPFVLVVEGAIPTATPAGVGVTPGDFCKIGVLATPGVGDTMLENVKAFANKSNCIAVLAVGTCASFGGIPGARGSVTGCKGVAFSGTSKGGAVVVNSGTVSNVHINSSTTHGTGYTSTPTVGFSGGGGTGAAATATVAFPLAVATYTTQEQGSGYTSDPTVSFLFGGGAGATASVTRVGDVITNLIVLTGGSGYIAKPIVQFTGGGGTGAQMAPNTVQLGNTAGFVHSVALTSGGSGYTSAPTVSFSGGGGAGAAAIALISSGDVTARKNTAAKVINISGCPPHPDWIVGTIAHVLDTALTLPPVNATYQPVDYGYAEYQCNAGPCPWRYNNSSTRPEQNLRYPEGNSKRVGKERWRSDAQGCFGILGCKGRKTKADCSRRRWNSDAAETYGVNWCVGNRGGCQGCTLPEFPDKVGKFYTFV